MCSITSLTDIGLPNLFSMSDEDSAAIAYLSVYYTVPNIVWYIRNCDDFWGVSEGEGAVAAGVGDGAGGLHGGVACGGGGCYEDDAEFAFFEHSGEVALAV